MLLDEPKIKKNHQVTDTNFIHPSSQEAYDTFLLRKKNKKAKEVDEKEKIKFEKKGARFL